MKVLFAVNNETVSESIIKKYQSNYKEIISAKNVYYFNAIIKELQRDKSYDRVVISEDLEPFSNKNYDMMDKFLFEKLDSISDEASNSIEGEIPIIVICAVRREKADSMLLKMFSIGIYSALIGNDRTIENVCDLINKPRNKKEAKVYYKIESDEADYKSENADNVSETEIQNILIHYKKLGRNEDKYIESFNNISSQYTDAQLKLIASFLPLNVKAVLEERCPKYQELMVGSVKNIIKKSHTIVTKDVGIPKNNPNVNILSDSFKKPEITDPVVIPSAVNTANVRKVYNNPVRPQEVLQPQLNNTETMKSQPQQTIGETSPVRRGRGRPPKVKPIEPQNEIQQEQPAVAEVKRGRGRPRKINPEEVANTNTEPLQQTQEGVNLFALGEENNAEENQQKQNAGQIGNNDFEFLPGLETDKFFNNDNTSWTKATNTVNESNRWNNQTPISQTPISQTPINQGAFNANSNTQNNLGSNMNSQNGMNQGNFAPTTINQNLNQSRMANLSVSESKIVTFVGTSKNGTSFLINNLAIMLSSKGINTAILDLTKNKNAYYIYTQNDEQLRKKAANCIEQLRRGNPDGIKVNKNLTVYTPLPNEESGIEDYSNILNTLSKNYSLVLLDCDFDTDFSYFSQAQEIYLVQTYDVLTIQPLTTFLRDLLDKNILDPNKLRIVINKSLKVPGLTKEMIIGGISSYNSPDMSCQRKFFNVETAIYVTIPFEDQTYAKYLGSLASCELSLNGYSKELLDSLARLGDMVYPLISNKPQNTKNYNDYSNNKKTFGFNSNVNNTLNKMRNIY